MCDSIIFDMLINNLADAEYDQARFPAKGAEDSNVTSADFRDQYPVSPLTGAGFKITAFGMPKPGSDETIVRIEDRLQHGRIAGYRVELNPPACTVGHNRVLVNGVPAAVEVGTWLAKYWLVSNGCTQAGIDAINPEIAIIFSATPTFLFQHISEDDARYSLAGFRSRAEILLNKKRKAIKDGKAAKGPVRSIPPEPDGRTDTYVYTVYIRQREYLIDGYVKVPGVAKAFCKPVDNSGVEFSLEFNAKRTLRLGTKLHGKWLRDNGLDRISGWRGNPGAYEKAFNLIRKDLRLDEELRSKQLRMPTVANLNLPALDKKLLRYHLKGGIVSEHPHFQTLSARQASKVYSAIRTRVFQRTEGIDFEIEYEDQKHLHPQLVDLLKYLGEYVPEEKAAPYVFSRVSLSQAVERLKKLVAQVLRYGPDSVPQMPNLPVDDDNASPAVEESRFARALRRIGPVNSDARDDE
jgi:hypothetical protein